MRAKTHLMSNANGVCRGRQFALVHKSFGSLRVAELSEQAM